MTQDQAEEIVMILKAATGGRADQTTIDYFQAALLDLRFEIALSTATTGVVVWRWFPSWAEFWEIYKTQERLSQPIGEQRADSPLPDPKYGTAAPEWVWVWGWCRTQRHPRNLIAFPQQGLPGSEPQLSQEEYEALRTEWIEAGQPKAKIPLPLARDRGEAE